MTTLPEIIFGRFDTSVERIVERQEDSATTRITEDLIEQQMLEELLERSKPGLLNGRIHYLLGTPFRYPPLDYGSRFGTPHDRWIFYGSLDSETCLRECGYYRLKLLFDMAEPPPRPLGCEHTMFAVELAAERSVDLCSQGYAGMSDDLASVESYALTHRIGQQARDANAQMLVFQSARGAGKNVAVFDEDVFASEPVNQRLWISQVRSDRVMFRGKQGFFQFPVEDYESANGEFPRIAI
ncbi:MAG: RES family NAD+ phosphorylase [Pseudomonadota bacterium]